MRRWFILLGVLIFPFVVVGQTDEQEAQQELRSGEKVSTALAAITSTAISPLVGVCVLGMWQYYHTPPEQRDQLPLIQKPKFWIPIMVLLVLIFIKDTVGGFAPLIKKPLDAVEVLLVNHAALVLIAFPVVLEQVARVMGVQSLRGIFGYLLSQPTVYAATAQTSGVHHALSVATAALYTVVGLIVTFVVWLVGHSLDVLAMISPFPFLDFWLKIIRNTIFAVLAVTAVISPHLGLVLCLTVIVFSFLVFGWALRTAVFGTVFAWELLQVLLFDVQSKPKPGESVPAFSTRVRKVPRRTYGRLYAGPDGSLLFGYRRLLVGPEKKVTVGKASSFEVGQGVFFPSVIEPIESAGKHRVVFRLLPTHRGAEESVRSCLELAQVRDVRFTRGLRSFWAFVTEGGGESSVSP
ncbi:MAG TPA: hypothetical protein VEI52_02030 [Terriglobales bacterium]|nr:hypothetical protein [Terriglobales bacterium]